MSILLEAERSASADGLDVVLPNDRTRDDVFSLYARCSFIRKFEQQLLDLFGQGKLSGTTHTGIGQEANAVGIATACSATDIFVSNHRCHAHLLAHVGQPNRLLAEIMGDASGFCGGMGGSQHICVPGRFYSNGIQGGIAPLAAGLAWAKKRANSQDIVCLFIGDGTTGEGALYEALNLAGSLRLPLLVVLENNGVAQTTLTSGTIAGSIRDRFEAFAFEVHEITYPTAGELAALTGPVVERVRSGIPSAIVIESARLGPHSKGDDTRSTEMLAAYRERDPMRRMAEELRRHGTLERAEAVADLLLAELADAPSLAVEVKAPLHPDYLKIAFSAADLAELDGTQFVDRVNACLADFLGNVDRSLLIGEDIGDPYGGAFKVSKGLQNRFPEQIIEAPISEAGFTGMAAGIALSGHRPIVEIMFGDFVTLAFDQLVNHASKYPLMYDGQVTCPLIVRLPMGAGRGYGPTHSQSLEKHLCGVPNLQVLALSPFLPTGPIFRALIQAKGPVVLVEYKLDYTQRIDRRQNLIADFDIVFHGSCAAFSLKGSGEADVAVFAYGGMIPIALEAARQLFMEEELNVHVLAVTQLHPLSVDDILSVVAPQLRVVATIEESTTGWGFGAEIAAAVLGSPHLERKPQFIRLGFPEIIVPASRLAEKSSLPDGQRLVDEILRSLSA